MQEVWRKIEGYEHYEVSNLNGWKNTTRKIQSKGHYKKGYRYVCLGKVKGDVLYHILVAKAFPEICGQWFENAQVHHINFDKTDNRPENLIVITQSEHSKLHYKYQSDTFKKPSKRRSKSISKALKGQSHPERYVPIIQYSLDGQELCYWFSLKGIREEKGYDISNISSCCRGRIKTAYGFKWSYAA